MTLARKVNCPLCKAECTLTVAGKFRDHGPKEDRCDMSGCFIPAALQAPLPPTTPDAAVAADRVLPGRPAVPLSGSNETVTCPEPPTIPPKLSGASVPAEPVTSTNGLISGIIPETNTFPITTLRSPHSESAVATTTTPTPPATAATARYEQPDKLPGKERAAVIPMTEQEQQVVTMLREMFYQYSNRSRRSQQKTMGPSQIGTPCDRKLVMHLLGAPKVNPGGDNWAAFRGTQIHRGLEDMLKWADAGKGRFGTELRVKLNSLIVPGGTLDAIDRILFMVDDHKTMGGWSLDKLRTTGMSPLHRTQLHVYGMGARQRGEKVEHVALIGWPADESNLDNLWVKIEPYDPQIARQALARVDELKAYVDDALSGGLSPQEVATQTPIADDCRYCPYHMKDAADLSNGACNGRR